MQVLINIKKIKRKIDRILNFKENDFLNIVHAHFWTKCYRDLFKLAHHVRCEYQYDMFWKRNQMNTYSTRVHYKIYVCISIFFYNTYMYIYTLFNPSNIINKILHTLHPKLNYNIHARYMKFVIFGTTVIYKFIRWILENERFWVQNYIQIA